jgi:hypothetical protein
LSTWRPIRLWGRVIRRNDNWGTLANFVDSLPQRWRRR